MLVRLRPKAVIGFGGYPTLPPIIAASTLRIPTAIHEQNAVMGRANRLLSRFVDRIGLSFMPTKLLGPEAEPRRGSSAFRCATRCSNFATSLMSRRTQAPACCCSSSAAAKARASSPRRCRRRSRLLPEPIRARVTLVQQAREEDLDGLRDAYARGGIAAHLAPFFRDLPERIATAHLVIARAGASTVAELTTIGRPCLLVPLPHALDNDQLENATRLQDVGGGWCVRQAELTPERLAELLQALLSRAAASRRGRKEGACHGDTRCGGKARRSR